MPEETARPTYALGEECHHGSLKRKCERCELRWELDRAEARVKELEGAASHVQCHGRTGRERRDFGPCGECGGCRMRALLPTDGRGQ
jgi:hypothetical protein